MALGTLAKGPVGILIPLLGVVPYLTLTRQWKLYFKEGRPLLGWTLCVLIAAPWYLAMLSIHGADYVAAAQANTTGRFANPMEGHGGTLLFYVPVLLLGFFPWSGLLPAALWQSIKEWKSFRTGATDPRGEEGLLLFCALWVSGIFLFFTISATRLPHYVLPLYPPGRPAGGRALVPFPEERLARRPDCLEARHPRDRVRVQHRAGFPCRSSMPT